MHREESKGCTVRVVLVHSGGGGVLVHSPEGEGGSGPQRGQYWCTMRGVLIHIEGVYCCTVRAVLVHSPGGGGTGPQ